MIKNNYNNKYILNILKKEGWFRYKNAFSKKITDKLKLEIRDNEKKYIEIQKKNGLGLSAKNTFHHIPLVSKTSLKILEKMPIKKFLKVYFDGFYILNIMGAVAIKPNKEITSTQKIHRDIRSFSYDYPLTLVVICLLDDSNKENGSTIFMKKSHLIKDKPLKKKFFKKKIQIEGKRGDLILFNSNMWHCSGKNITSKDRYISTIVYSKPFYKQALYYPKAFGEKFKKKISPYLKQILGYNAKVPESLDEWYALPDKRFYKSNQG